MINYVQNSLAQAGVHIHFGEKPKPKNTFRETFETGVRITANVLYAATPHLFPDNVTMVNNLIASVSTALLISPQKDEGMSLAKATDSILRLVSLSAPHLAQLKNEVKGAVGNVFKAKNSEVLVKERVVAKVKVD